jgi:hypothetical protein
MPVMGDDIQELVDLDATADRILGLLDVSDTVLLLATVSLAGSRTKCHSCRSFTHQSRWPAFGHMAGFLRSVSPRVLRLCRIFHAQPADPAHILGRDTLQLAQRVTELNPTVVDLVALH